jgi:hypothetical protein
MWSWRSMHPPDARSGTHTSGPRARTRRIAGRPDRHYHRQWDAVFAVGPHGVIVALDRATGRERWRHDLQPFGAAMLQWAIELDLLRPIVAVGSLCVRSRSIGSMNFALPRAAIKPRLARTHHGGAYRRAKNPTRKAVKKATRCRQVARFRIGEMQNGHEAASPPGRDGVTRCNLAKSCRHY